MSNTDRSLSTCIFTLDIFFQYVCVLCILDSRFIVQTSRLFLYIYIDLFFSLVEHRNNVEFKQVLQKTREFCFHF
jgi:hypothetical protein